MLEAIESLRKPSQIFMKTNASKEVRAGLKGVLGDKGGFTKEELQIKQDRNTRAKLLRVGQIRTLSF